jgi:hypothetical protein
MTEQTIKQTESCKITIVNELTNERKEKVSPQSVDQAGAAVMRHKSYLTTQRYINMARQLDQAVETLHVPEVLRRPKIG